MPSLLVHYFDAKVGREHLLECSVSLVHTPTPSFLLCYMQCWSYKLPRLSGRMAALLNINCEKSVALVLMLSWRHQSKLHHGWSRTVSSKIWWWPANEAIVISFVYVYEHTQQRSLNTHPDLEDTCYGALHKEKFLCKNTEFKEGGGHLLKGEELTICLCLSQEYFKWNKLITHEIRVQRLHFCVGSNIASVQHFGLTIF